jgi:hypothetical protein
MKKNLLSILALSFGISSFAQIVYTDITDVTLTPSATRETLAINLDGNSTVDYTFFAVDTTLSINGQSIPTKAIGISFSGANEAAGAIQTITMVGDVLNIDALNAGDDISSSLTFLNNSSSSSLIFNGGGLGVHTSLISAGNYLNTTDKFIPLHFAIGGNMHYGWIRVDVADNAASITIKDFAYENANGDPINAGANGGVSINEKELNSASVFFGNGQLNLNGISGSYSVAVVDLLGKSISNSIVTNNASINLGNVNNGIYLVQITKGNSVVTKKVYIK